MCIKKLKEKIMEFKQIFVPSQGRSDYDNGNGNGGNNGNGNGGFSGGGNGGGGGKDWTSDISGLDERITANKGEIEGLRTDVGNRTDEPSQDGSIYARLRFVENAGTSSTEKVEALRKDIMYDTTFYMDALETLPDRVMSKNENKAALQNIERNYFNSSGANGLAALPIFVRERADAHSTMTAKLVDVTEGNNLVTKVRIVFESAAYRYVYEFNQDGIATEISKELLNDGGSQAEEIKKLREDLGTREDKGGNAFNRIRTNEGAITQAQGDITTNSTAITNLEEREKIIFIYNSNGVETNRKSYTEFYEALNSNIYPYVKVKPDAAKDETFSALSISVLQKRVKVYFIERRIVNGAEKSFERMILFNQAGGFESKLNREIHQDMSALEGDVEQLKTTVGEHTTSIQALTENDNLQDQDITNLRNDLGTNEGTEDAFTRIRVNESKIEGMETSISSFEELDKALFFCELGNGNYYKSINKKTIEYLYKHYTKEHTLPVYARLTMNEEGMSVVDHIDVASTGSGYSSVTITFDKADRRYTYTFNAAGVITAHTETDLNQDITDINARIENIQSDATALSGRVTANEEALAKIGDSQQTTFIYNSNGVETNKVSYTVAKQALEGNKAIAVGVKPDATKNDVFMATALSLLQDRIKVSFIERKIVGGAEKDYERTILFNQAGGFQSIQDKEIHSGEGGTLEADVEQLKVDTAQLRIDVNEDAQTLANHTEDLDNIYSILNMQKNLASHQYNIHIQRETWTDSEAIPPITSLDHPFSIVIENYDDEIRKHPEDYRIVLMFFKKKSRRRYTDQGALLYYNGTRKWTVPMFCRKWNVDTGEPTPGPGGVVQQTRYNWSDTFTPFSKEGSAEVQIYPSGKELLLRCNLKEGQRNMGTALEPNIVPSGVFAGYKNKKVQLGWAIFKKTSEEFLMPDGSYQTVRTGQEGWTRVSNIARVQAFMTGTPGNTKIQLQNLP